MSSELKAATPIKTSWFGQVSIQSIQSLLTEVNKGHGDIPNDH